MGAETDEAGSAPAEGVRVKQRRFTVLLSLLSLLLVSGPLIRGVGTGRFLTLKSFLFALVFTAILLSAAVAVDAGRRQARFLYGLATAWILLRTADVLEDHESLTTASHVVALVFLGLVILLLLHDLLRRRSADGETIAAALCVYLIMGVFWAIGYALADVLQPGSFRIPAGTSLDFGAEGALFANYFSFATLTTVGFGDITPQTDVTRMMAVAEAVLGQVFLVVLVARLVGLSVSEGIRDVS